MGGSESPEVREARRIGKSLADGDLDRNTALSELSVIYRTQQTESARDQVLKVASEESGIGRSALKKDLEHLGRFSKEKASAVSIGPLKILKLVKFDTRPAIWEITLEIKDREGTFMLRTDTETLTTTKKFNNTFWEEHTFFPLPTRLKADHWYRALEAAPVEIQKESSHEATPRGYLKQAVEDFEGNAQPDKGTGLALNVAPILTDDHEVLLRLPTLMRFLKSEGIEKRTRVEVISILRQLGYRDEVRRIGGDPTRIWYRAPVSQEGFSNGKL